jgi:hypothetical protein
MGLIDEASHVLMARYREQFDPEVMTAGAGLVLRAGGAEALDEDAAGLCRAVSRFTS